METITGKLAGVSPRLDGLRVHVIDDENDLHHSITNMLMEVRSIGGMPVQPETFYVNFANVDQSPDPSDLATDNPYGRYLDTLEYSDQSAVVVISIYERCTHVHFSNPRTGATLHDSVHWGETDNEIIDKVKRQWKHGEELVDMIFEFRG